MGFTPEQIKGRIKSVAKQNNADARTLMRIYMMERFLERLAQSEYRDNFIIKGGILVTAMIGVAHRSTMDIDTSMKNLNLSAEDEQPEKSLISCGFTQLDLFTSTCFCLSWCVAASVISGANGFWLRSILNPPQRKLIEQKTE